MKSFTEYLKEERLDRMALSKIVEDDYDEVKEVARGLDKGTHEKLRLAIEEYKRAMEVARRFYHKAKKGEGIE
jgi:hypothetical protein